jgi:predicted RNA-binding Zn-ribbon protein involved in translation (DUF1610 family)
MKDDFESVVNCPNCGREATVELQTAKGLTGLLESLSGAGTHAYNGAAKCASCGAGIIVSLSVSAIKKEAGK